MQRIGDIPPAKISQLTAELTKMQIDMDLRRKIREDIKRLRDIGSYRGRRHAQVCFFRLKGRGEGREVRLGVW